MSEQADEQQDERFDLASVFPSKGDPRRPPEWFGRGLLYAAIAVFAAVFVWNTWPKVSSIVLYIIISLFIALAVEPVVRWLVSHGWKRGIASGVTLVSLVVILIGLLTLFGNMFVQQLVGMMYNIPSLYGQIVDVIQKQTNWRAPAMNELGVELMKSLKTDTITNFASQALSTTASLLGVLLGVLTVMLVTYYLSAALPRMRRSLCQWIAPKSQERFLVVWTVVQDQISNFLYSRIILALISSVCMSIFMVCLKIPYWLPLSIFCGLISQFVPTVGTYIGGALPVVSAWGTNGFKYALFLLIYIIVYQQIENMLLSPAISQRTMDLNPAIAFLAVLAFGSVFGALGAFLALPLTASLQVIFKAYTKRYELIDSPLLSDSKMVKKSKMVSGVEAFSEHVIKPVTDHMPRAAKGSSARVHTDDQWNQYLQERLVSPMTSEELDESQTVAIPKKQPQRGKPDLNGGSDAVDDAQRQALEDEDTERIESIAERAGDTDADSMAEQLDATEGKPAVPGDTSDNAGNARKGWS